MAEDYIAGILDSSLIIVNTTIHLSVLLVALLNWFPRSSGDGDDTVAMLGKHLFSQAEFHSGQTEYRSFHCCRGAVVEQASYVSLKIKLCILPS